jgi:DNA replication and repair protein RecF
MSATARATAPAVRRAKLRGFRNHERAEVELCSGLNVLLGPNGAGKSNLLEALYFGCTGRACRTSNERELVKVGDQVARVELEVAAPDGSHTLEAALEPGRPKRLRVDGADVEALADSEVRPLVSVFLPDRLELVKGSPGGRRGHVDRLVAALWPARSEARSAYSQALAHRNALLLRIRSGSVSADSLDAWDGRLAEPGWELMTHRSTALDLLREPFAARALDLGLPEPAEIAYAPRSRANTPEELRSELAERRPSDLDRGFTQHGPHRDEVVLRHGGMPLRAYGSQGQQRLALLALLFAERDVLMAERDRAPLMLLDDVMSELDGARRERLVDLLKAGGQAVVTATEAEHVPASGNDVSWVAVMPGATAAAPESSVAT